MGRRAYSGTAQATTLVGSITNLSMTFTVADATNLPVSGAFVITVDRGLAGEEKMLVASRSGTTLTIGTRGFDGTLATAHQNSAAVEHTFSATDADEANGHVNSGVGFTPTTAHGVDFAEVVRLSRPVDSAAVPTLSKATAIAAAGNTYFRQYYLRTKLVVVDFRFQAGSSVTDNNRLFFNPGAFPTPKLNLPGKSFPICKTTINTPNTENWILQFGDSGNWFPVPNGGWYGVGYTGPIFAGDELYGSFTYEVN